jgi:hypothetical protein
MKKSQNPVYRLGNFLARLSKSVVSGIPREKPLSKPRSGKYFHLKKQNMHHDFEKHYKPRIHRKTMDHYWLMKEKKRIRVEG